MAGTAKKTAAASKTAATAKTAQATPTAGSAETTTSTSTSVPKAPDKAPTKAQVEKARAGNEDLKAVDSDGYPLGDHLGGTASQDVSAQITENVKGNGDAPVTGATTAAQSRTREGDNPEANAVPSDNGTVNVPGHTPYAPTAAPLERPRNPVYTPENIDPETQVGRDNHEPVEASAVAPNVVATNSRLVDEAGKKVAVGSVFDDSKGPENFRTVVKRVYIEEPLAGAKDATTKRLLFPKGARVNVDTVARLKREWA